MSVVTIGPYDFEIIQMGDVYVVSGKDAGKLHAKMRSIPDEASDLVVGDLQPDGSFTLKKTLLTASVAHGYSAATIQATAG